MLVVRFDSLMSFSAAELRDMFCGEENIEWNEQQLLVHVRSLITIKTPFVA